MHLTRHLLQAENAETVNEENHDAEGSDHDNESTEGEDSNNPAVAAADTEQTTLNRNTGNGVLLRHLKR